MADVLFSVRQNPLSEADRGVGCGPGGPPYNFVLLCALLTAAVVAGAQPLSVYSEFARVDAKGHVTVPESPREILSPAVARNAFTSFQVVVEVPENKSWWRYIGLNPENAVRVTVYREADGELEPEELPVVGKGTQVFWMDLWT